MLKTILVVLIVLIVGILGFSATRSDTFRVQRSATIKAPADRVYGMISDFHQWSTWSPWEKLDPAMKKTYGGAANGTGTTYAWEGNNKVGQGNMEITHATPPAKVLIRLHFIKPFEATNTAEFTLRPVGGDTTEVTWAMFGPMNFISKVMCLFVSMDKMVGDDFATGLANLKANAEK